LGCNAGYISIQAALLGAKVLSVEISNRYFNQAAFTKEYFEYKTGKKLDITFIQSDICDLDFLSLGKFDFIFALAILYHIGKQKYGKYTAEALAEQEIAIQKMTQMSKKILVRARNGKFNNVDYYSKIFEKFNFKPTNIIRQNIRRSLVLYQG
jgi:cyclopropane fatty-acyl-phospholipid synthase-like methyltransferase